MDVRSLSVPESCCVPFVGLTSAMSGACASDAVERVAAARAAAKATAKALPKSRGRHRNEDRPRIDIDDEIESANELSTLMKKSLMLPRCHNGTVFVARPGLSRNAAN